MIENDWLINDEYEYISFKTNRIMNSEIKSCEFCGRELPDDSILPNRVFSFEFDTYICLSCLKQILDSNPQELDAERILIREEFRDWTNTL